MGWTYKKTPAGQFLLQRMNCKVYTTLTFSCYLAVIAFLHGVSIPHTFGDTLPCLLIHVFSEIVHWSPW